MIKAITFTAWRGNLTIRRTFPTPVDDGHEMAATRGALKGTGERDFTACVEQTDGSVVTVAPGRVRMWLAGEVRTLLDPALTVVVFVAGKACTERRWAVTAANEDTVRREAAMYLVQLYCAHGAFASVTLPPTTTGRPMPSEWFAGASLFTKG